MTKHGELVAAGRTSEVFAFGSGAVVKVPRPGVPGHWAGIEARLTEAVRGCGVPAPAVLGLEEVDGRESIVFERIEGVSMWDRMRSDPSDGPALGRELADVHREITRVGLADGVPDVVNRMRSRIQAIDSLTERQHAEAFEIVGQLPRGAALLHGDLHPQNVLMSPSGPVVIDWFDAAIGHPVADVVRSSILMRPPHSGVEVPHLPGAAPGLRQAVHDEYVSGFADLLDHQREWLPQWEAVVGLSRIAEHAQHDESALLSLWVARNGPEPSPFLRSVAAAS